MIAFEKKLKAQSNICDIAKIDQSCELKYEVYFKSKLNCQKSTTSLKISYKVFKQQCFKIYSLILIKIIVRICFMYSINEFQEMRFMIFLNI